MKNSILLMFLLFFGIDAFAFDITSTITSNGITRSFIIHAPGTSIASNLPVMIIMHGDGGTALNLQSYVGFDAAADAQNFVAVYPDAINMDWNRNADNVPGDACTSSSNTSDDVLFISDLIDYLCSTYSVNRNKVYATGFSAGGYMTYNLAIQLTNKIAAFAPVAGSLCGDAAFITAANASNPKVPIYHIHGDSDNVVNYPDPNQMPDDYQEWPLSNFSGVNCAAATYTSISTIVPGVKKIVFCGSPKPVELIQIVGGSHSWPNVAGYDAATAIFNFCNAFSLSLGANCSQSVFLNELTPEMTLEAFPNPCKNGFQLKNSENYNSIKFLNQLGQEIAISNIENQIKFQQEIKSGLYFLQCKNLSGGNISIKVIVE